MIQTVSVIMVTAQGIKAYCTGRGRGGIPLPCLWLAMLDIVRDFDSRGYVCAISYKCAWLLLLTTARDSGSRPISVFLVWAVAEWLCGGSYSYDE